MTEAAFGDPVALYSLLQPVIRHVRTKLLPQLHQRSEAHISATWSLVVGELSTVSIHSLDACHINNSDGHWLDFTVRLRILFQDFTRHRNQFRDFQVFFQFPR